MRLYKYSVSKLLLFVMFSLMLLAGCGSGKGEGEKTELTTPIPIEANELKLSLPQPQTSITDYNGQATFVTSQGYTVTYQVEDAINGLILPGIIITFQETQNKGVMTYVEDTNKKYIPVLILDSLNTSSQNTTLIKSAQSKNPYEIGVKLVMAAGEGLADVVDGIIWIKLLINDPNTMGVSPNIRCITVEQAAKLAYYTQKDEAIDMLFAIGEAVFPGELLPESANRAATFTKDVLGMLTEENYITKVAEFLKAGGVIKTTSPLEMVTVDLKGTSLFSSIVRDVQEDYVFYPATPKYCGDNAPSIPPSNLRVMETSSSQIDLSWDDTQNEIAYIVFSSADGIIFQKVGSIAEDITNFSHQYLSPNTTYFYRIYSMNSKGLSTTYSEAKATTLPLHNRSPIISLVKTDNLFVNSNDVITVACNASDPDGDTLIYIWGKTGGTILGSGSIVTWEAPSMDGMYTIICNVSDGKSKVSKGIDIGVVSFSPPNINSLTISPSAVSLGDTFTINYNITNPNSAMDVILGAGIGPSGTTTWALSDPANDIKFNIVSGTSYVSRKFTVPSFTAPDTYDLLVALWFDVNNNNKIDIGIDKFLVSKTIRPALVVQKNTNTNPIISSVITDRSSLNIGGIATLFCIASDPDGDALSYSWTSTVGSFTGSISGSVVTWVAPSTVDTYQITCSVSDGKGGSDSEGINISVISSTTVTPPVAPSNLIATAMGQNSITLTWQDNSDNETGFKIERKTGSSGTYSQIALWPAQAGYESGVAYDDTGLTAGTTYCYKVRAYNTYDSSYSNENCATTQSQQTIKPTAITGTASNTTSNSATLNGTINPNGVLTSAFFIWDTKTPPLANSTTPTQNYSGTNNVSITANITGLTPNTLHYFRIVAVTSTETVYGDPVAFTTSASTINNSPVISSIVSNPVSPVSVGSTLTITCAASDPDGDALSYSWTSSGGSFSGSVSGSVVTWVAPSTVGTYQITCSVSDGKGGSDSTGISISVIPSTTVTLPVAPSNLTATAMGQNSIALTWQDNSDNETGFKIERKTGTSGTFAPLPSAPAKSGSGSGVAYDDSSLTANTTYCYRVLAYNTAGDSSYTSESCATTWAQQSAKPTATTGTASNTTSNSATLNGIINPNGVPTSAFFVWDTKTPPLANLTTPTQNYSGTSNISITANITGLEPNTLHYFRIVAVTSTETVYGDPVAFTTSSESLPGSFTLSGTTGCNGSSPANYLSWTTSSGVASYAVYRCTGSGCTPTWYYNLATLGTTFTNTNVISGTTYSYFIRATNSSGYTDSNWGTIVTRSSCP